MKQRYLQVQRHSDDDGEEESWYECRMFDFRVLFLFTALCPEQRDLARHNHGAVPILLQV